MKNSENSIASSSRGVNLDVSNDPEDRMVTVCSKCFKASCWHGVFYCDQALDAGSVDLPARELRKLNLEHEIYWN